MSDITGELIDANDAERLLAEPLRIQCGAEAARQSARKAALRNSFERSVAKMKVGDVMTKTPASCRPETNLGSAVEVLWNRNCGILPVVDGDERVVSVITERDICIALGTRNRLPGELTVGEVATQRAICCGADEDFRSALGKMAGARVRRLPVVNTNGGLVGLLSMDDVVRRTNPKSTAKDNEPTSDEVVSTLKRLYTPQLSEE
jgi:CBS domain-containing protein